MSENAALSRDEAFARIRLLRSPNVGPVSYRQLLARFGSGIAALDALPDIAGRSGKRYQPAAADLIENELADMRKAGARYLFHDAPGYPELLAASEGAPPILVLRGNAALLRAPSVALVGARNASAGAIRMARAFAMELVSEGMVVVSGLARGIDGAAHEGALAVADGAGTIGVIASGIDLAYPPEHAGLQARIAADGGLLLTEQPCGAQPLSRNFPARNRMIAGLCAGTVIVEAAPRSGSLITARLAGEMGREVMAVPGSPLDARSRGCNQLIRDGATLVQSASDVLELLRDFTGSPRDFLREETPSWPNAPAIPDETAPLGSCQIEQLLGTAPVTVDEIVRLSGTGPGAVQLVLLELELAGRLVRHAGGRVALTGNG